LPDQYLHAAAALFGLNLPTLLHPVFLAAADRDVQPQGQVRAMQCA
jgi:hypothetical protein